MWQDIKNIIEEIKKEEWANNIPSDEIFWPNLEDCIEGFILPEFLAQFSHKIKEIIEIDPELPEKQILEKVTFHIVDYLGAQFASIRLYDPNSEQLLSFGSYPPAEEFRETSIPLDKTIAGEVVRSHRTYIVPNIMKEEMFLDKGIVDRRGANSLMAIPLEIPRFFPHERDTIGVIQIYYPEVDRLFSSLEIQMAEIMSRRLSFVVARKKIRTMQLTNEKKDAIVRKIFLMAGATRGIKMKDVFNRVIPELADIINIQSCALFSVSDNMRYAILDAGYPDSPKDHGIGMKFETSSEPAFELVLNLMNYTKKTPYEIVTSSYILVMDPQKSDLVSDSVKRFSASRNVNSILYIPLTEGENVTHFITFDAMEQRQSYSPEEIEILLFLGRELMKAHRIEQLDDILHDFKNPAIATAGFARRLRELLEVKDPSEEKNRIKKYVDILFEETSRLEEMAMSISQVGKEEVVDLSKIIKRRCEINKEAIREQLRQNIVLKEGPYHENLMIKCYPLFLERVLDNLLNNATNAIPLGGGILSVRTYREKDWACIEISNTGTIPEDERLRLLEGEGSGRGFYITYRIIRLLEGKIDIQSSHNTTTITVRIPFYTLK